MIEPLIKFCTVSGASIKDKDDKNNNSGSEALLPHHSQTP